MEQNNTVMAYIDSFEELMGKLKMQMPSVTEDYFVGSFISRLKEHIKVPVRSHYPRTLIEAYSLARNYDIAAQKKTIFEPFRGIPRTSYPSKFSTTSIKREAPEEKQATRSKWEKNKCYKCQEP
jgi:hypothetical protein